MRLTVSELRAAASSARLQESARANLKTTTTYATTAVFLSHSHLDRELARGAKNLLAGLGISLYIDWEDTAMPTTPTRETADRIKRRIGACGWFLLLGTNNALASRWVPWEVGIADHAKGASRTLIWPVDAPDGAFRGSEYLQLYRRIERVQDMLQVIEPGRSMGASLREALASR